MCHQSVLILFISVWSPLHTIQRPQAATHSLLWQFPRDQYWAWILAPCEYYIAWRSSEKCGCFEQIATTWSASSDTGSLRYGGTVTRCSHHSITDSYMDQTKTTDGKGPSLRQTWLANAGGGRPKTLLVQVLRVVCWRGHRLGEKGGSTSTRYTMVDIPEYPGWNH